eukprot:m.478110 g.478110  ORF g.478110 m.478110 type:complete len:66 (-) comp21691_c0_seq3:2075-2272(-)
MRLTSSTHFTTLVQFGAHYVCITHDHLIQSDEAPSHDGIDSGFEVGLTAPFFTWGFTTCSCNVSW